MSPLSVQRREFLKMADSYPELETPGVQLTLYKIEVLKTFKTKTLTEI